MASASALHPRGVTVLASWDCLGTIYTQEHFPHSTEGFWVWHLLPAAFIQPLVYNSPEPSIASAVTAQWCTGCNFPGSPCTETMRLSPGLGYFKAAAMPDVCVTGHSAQSDTSAGQSLTQLPGVRNCTFRQVKQRWHTLKLFT